MALAAAGADVALHWYRDESLAQTTAEEIRRLDRKAVVLYADMGVPSEARKTVRSAAEALGGLSILVCNAARIQRKAFFEITDEDWSALHSVNLHGYFACGQEAARVMTEQEGGGRIVMISSVNQAHAKS